MVIDLVAGILGGAWVSMLVFMGAVGVFGNR